METMTTDFLSLNLLGVVYKILKKSTSWMRMIKTPPKNNAKVPYKILILTEFSQKSSKMKSWKKESWKIKKKILNK